ncbi:hypothetical protein QE390_003383 [Siphonobacter sp. SORGH_AS 1065]|nr:hypothetical protein [Siphonobacter sp. SORGH_AS_1065]
MEKATKNRKLPTEKLRKFNLFGKRYVYVFLNHSLL